MRVPTVGIVTCRVLPEPDPDQELMLSELSSAGLSVQLLPWDDESADPAAFDACILRSCWDYHERPDDFLAWCDAAATQTRLLNPPTVVRWNAHKRYLRDLEAAGIPIVPTAFFDRASNSDLASLLDDRSWTDIVIKPCVSAGSARTRRFRDAARTDAANAAAFLAELTTTADTMIQPFMPSVETTGERAAVWIAGQPTHAIVKQPRFHDDDESVSEAVPVTDTERELFDRCLALASEPVLYARLDTMPAADGTPLISELELIEPSLFLLQSEAATRAFVEAVLRAAG
ncbi:MAG: hypothetical protein AAGF47_05190 [Planctomycetota bacterium]